MFSSRSCSHCTGAWGRQAAALQNLLLLVSSYFFYATLDLRFAALLFGGTAIDFFIGSRLGTERRAARRKTLIRSSLFVNLALLGYFKYLGFFLESAAGFLGLFGLESNPVSLGIIMPVGISYFTFKRLSYTIDIYRETIEPTRDPVAFFSFVAFFPQLLAGPIDRAGTLLPQFLKRREFRNAQARDGLRQILSGLMKKLIIADNLVPVVGELFSNYGSYDGLSLAIGVFFAAMQLYCDFAGYSDLAIGIGKLLGFTSMRNFSVPYFSRDIAEFWRRWHISLSSWLRDYLYVPMCGIRPSRRRKAACIVFTFALCGLWHEPAWTYVFWGFLHGLYFLPLTLRKMHPRYIGLPAAGRVTPTFREGRAMAFTFLMTSFAWVFFRADSFSQAVGFLARAVSHPFLSLGYGSFLPMLLACSLLLVIEWFQRDKEHLLAVAGLPVFVRWVIYEAAIILVAVFGAFGSNGFIYAQF